MRLADRLLRPAAIKRDYWEGIASGAAILTTSYGSPDREAILPQVTQWAHNAHGNNAIVFSAIFGRMLVFSEAELKLQAKDDQHLFTNSSLALLQEPFGPFTGTNELLARMEQDVSVAGNAYIWRDPEADQLVRLRPDWVTIVSQLVSGPNGEQYRRKVGYWHEPPKSVLGQGSGFFVPADEVAHWAPVPDPDATFRGMSWLTPVYRDIQGDSALGTHKIKYLENDATPNIVIKYAQKLHPGTVDSIRERMHARYGGPSNKGKVLVLDQGADLVAVGNSLAQMDFSNVAAAGEQRILAASMVPGVLIGLEPLRGAGRGFEESVTKFANMWARPAWRSVCTALAKFVPDLPGGARLWYDTSGIALLQDGIMERGQAALVRAQALLTLRQAGYTADSAVAAVDSLDLSQLKADPSVLIQNAVQSQHMLPQPGQPGATAQPLPPTLPRLPLGSVSPGDGGNGTRPTPRPAGARRDAN